MQKISVHHYILSVCVVIFCVVESTAQESPFELFEKYNSLTTKWIEGTGDKNSLVSAMSAISKLVPWLESQVELPPGLDPLEFADNILSFHQSNEHISYALRMFECALKTKMQDNSIATFKDSCASDNIYTRRICQDIYSNLILFNDYIGNTDKASHHLTSYNIAVPEHRKFISTKHGHRQLPIVRALPWWDIDDTTRLRTLPNFQFLNDIESKYNEIKNEIINISSDLVINNNWGMNLDLRLSTNEKWDPRTSWEAITLYSNGQWDADNCLLLKVTCDLLKKYDNAFKILFNRKDYVKLIQKRFNQVTLDTEFGTTHSDDYYQEVPTLGIKLYKVWPNAGIKPHMGSPGRVVHSIPIIAPTFPASTVTVANITMPWVEGKFLSFDDSFFHSVDNPHPITERIVLAFVTLHPDLFDDGFNHAPSLAKQEVISESDQQVM